MASILNSADPPPDLTDREISNVLHGREAGDNGEFTASSMGAAQEAMRQTKRSEGQKLLDRQLAVRNRLRSLHGRIGVVRASIMSPREARVRQTVQPGQATAFFDGMSLLTDEFEAVAAQLEESVADLETLF